MPKGVRWITIDAPVIPASTPGNTCNLLDNPGFENGLAEWNDWYGTLDIQLSGQAHTGAFAVRLGNPQGPYSQAVENITAGTSYTAGGMFQRNSGLDQHGHGDGLL